LVEDELMHLILVNDGSDDGTAALLDELADSHPRIESMHLDENKGKAEAVRLGMIRALDNSCELTGYIDADLATPPEEVLRLVGVLRDSLGVDAVIGSRIAFMGADIDRRPTRHYLGRVFATFASLALERSIYDTQCGAKFFRRSDALSACLEEPFASKWAFDVELLGRLFRRSASIREEPLRRWVHVDGSKLGPGSMVKAGFDLLRIGWRLRRE
jgi:dolichyl-phosphate beta-glucosyltransferase